MFSSHLAWYPPASIPAITYAFQQDGEGIWSQLNFASLLILIGIVILLLAIIGPSVRRIAVVEFIEPPKDGTSEKSKGIFGLREQIILGVLGLFLLGFGVAMQISSSGPGFAPTCKEAPKISVLKVANVCGCNVSDFGEIKVDSDKFNIVGEWIDQDQSLFNKDQLWALLIDENTDTIVAAKTVGINPPRWNVTFSLGNEIGTIYKIRLWVLDGKSVKILEQEKKNKQDLTMPDEKDNPYYQDILLERVLPTPETSAEMCTIPTRED